MKRILDKIKDFIKKTNKDYILMGIAVLAIIIVTVLAFTDSKFNFNFKLSLPNILGVSGNQMGEKVISYINDNQLSSSPAGLVSVSEASGLFKVRIKIGSNEFDSYATKDGKLLFPNAIEMVAQTTDKPANQNNNSGGNKTAEEIIASIKKSDSPKLEAFIVSRCPFGLQMQRMIYEAVRNIPSLAQYVAVKYMGAVSGNTITAMHGDAEAKENLRQICIREEQPAKYWDYVACQMKAGDTAGCEASTGVNSSALTACIADTNRGVAYAKKDFESSDAYGVTGSPTLAINGALIEEFTESGQPVFESSRSADEIRAIICEAFNNEASFCSQKLNTAKAATSFSETYAGSASASGDANCGQ